MLGSIGNHPNVEQNKSLTYYCKKSNVWTGSGSIILAEVSTGKGSVIGAESVVTQSIPENCLAVENPCKIIKSLNPNTK